MSVQFGGSAANYFYRGAPWDGGAYPGPVAQPDVTNFSISGLAYHTGVGAGMYEPIFGLSRRYIGGFIFVGKPDGGSIYFTADLGGGSHQIGAAAVPANTWIQWAFRSNYAASEASAMWKLLGDSAWTSQWAWATAPNFPAQRMFFGTDEWGASAGLWVLSNMRIWSGGAPLTDAELLTDVTSAALVRAANIFAWYKFKPGLLDVDSSGQNHPLTAAGAPAAGADSPLEAPPDGPTLSTATGAGSMRRWVAVPGNTAGAVASATGAARVARWTASGTAGVPFVQAIGAAMVRPWTGAGAAAAAALAAGAARIRRWTGRGVGTSIPAEPVPDTGIIPRRSAMGAVQIAIDAALQAAPAFSALVGPRVYSLGTVPKEPVAPYVELGESAERSAGAFMRGGNVNEETLTAVTARAAGKIGAATLAGALVDALDGKPLALAGHSGAHARLELLTMFMDPDTAHIRTVYRLTVQSWTAA